jgi:DNA transposition AAA+ family ATPase
MVKIYHSEIRTLLTQIEAEYQAGKLGLSGLSEGTSRHEVIERRMTRMGELHSQLHELVGDEAAKLVAHALDALPENPTTKPQTAIKT